MDSSYRVRTNRGAELDAVPLEELAKMLAEGAIDIDTPIKDLRSKKIFFPEQHPVLRNALNPADIALRPPVLPLLQQEGSGPTMVYLHVRNTLVITSLGVLIFLVLGVLLYRNLVSV